MSTTPVRRSFVAIASKPPRRFLSFFPSVRYSTPSRATAATTSCHQDDAANVHMPRLNVIMSRDDAAPEKMAPPTNDLSHCLTPRLKSAPTSRPAIESAPLRRYFARRRREVADAATTSADAKHSLKRESARALSQAFCVMPRQRDVQRDAVHPRAQRY